MNAALQRFWLALSATLVLGCTTTLPPDAFRIERTRVALDAPVVARVEAAVVANPRIEIMNPGSVFIADRNEMSRLLADSVRDSLRDSGATIGAGGAHVVVQVDHFEWISMVGCVATYRVSVNGAQARGMTSRSESGVGVISTCNRAFSSATREILESPEVRAILRKAE